MISKRTILLILSLPIAFSSFSQNRNMLDVKHGFNIFKIGNKISAYSDIISKDDYRLQKHDRKLFLINDYYYVGKSVTHLGEAPIKSISFNVDSKNVITTICVEVAPYYSVNAAIRSLYGKPQNEYQETQSCGATVFNSNWRAEKIALNVITLRHKSFEDSDNCIVPDKILITFSNISPDRQDIKDYNDKIKRIKDDF